MSETLLVERGARFRMTFSGDKAKEALGGLVTNDVVALRSGEGQRAAALTPKGRVIALVRVLDRGADLLVDGDGAASDGFIGMIRKFVNPRLAKHVVVTDQTDCLAVLGDHASRALSSALQALGMSILPEALEALGPFASLTVGEGEGALWLVRSADFSRSGFEVFGARERVADVRRTLADAGGRTASDEEARTLRVELGLPEWGVDMDAETIPQEAVLDTLGAISFNKGCYTGQEVVARIHFRGHVNRLLRHLTSDGRLRTGARVLDETGTDVGDVRSSVDTATRGPLALAMVRREVAPGSVVRVRDDQGEVTARVHVIANADANAGANAGVT